MALFQKYARWEALDRTSSSTGGLHYDNELTCLLWLGLKLFIKHRNLAVVVPVTHHKSGTRYK